MKKSYFLKNKITVLLLFTFSITFNSYGQCSVESLNNPEIGNDTTNLLGQSFTAGCSGDMSSFKTYCPFPSTLPSGTFNIYAGNTVTGTPIYTQVHPEIIITTAGDPITFNITGTMSVIQNSQYTFEYISSVDFHNDNSNPYAGGSFWYNGLELTTHDLTFTANIAQATLGVTEVELSNKKINLFPNPTTNFIQISGLSKKENYKIYNILGVEIKKGEISNNEKIKIKNFSNDLYFLKLENGNTLKFIKN